MLSHSCVKASSSRKNYVAPHERGLSDVALLALLKKILGSGVYKSVLKFEMDNGKNKEDATEIAKVAMRAKKKSLSLADIRSVGVGG